MDGKRLIRELRLQNFLSFGSEGEAIELQPLNVLIGPNASGKSNLIEAFALLRATPRDLTAPIREGGGAGEWLWKGSQDVPQGMLLAVVEYPKASAGLHYHLSFTEVRQRLEITDETIAEAGDEPGPGGRRFFYSYDNGTPMVLAHPLREQYVPLASLEERTEQLLPRGEISPEQSILSQRKDPGQYPEMTYLGEQFGKIALFREWALGRLAPPRRPQTTDLPQDFLLEDASNLGLVLNDLEHRGSKQPLLEHLRRFYEAVDDITTKIEGGTVQLFLHEKGLARPVPATRLSDGTLRYLCLLTILCHPDPPPLVCIEEPELGLHPDIIPTVAELLIDASQRTQLIVTTHSDMLVSALSDVPEAVVVCERDDAGTHLRRLDPEPLRAWLDDYRLGEAWIEGHLGGTRW